MRSLDYLPNSDIYLYQDSEMFKINSDTCFLGEFIEIKKNEVVLDVGTNNGALLLYASKFKYGKLIGVDINEEALKLCKENLELNKIEKYELYCKRVQDLDIDKVDVIVCNPPYFKNSLVNDNSSLRLARHDESLSISELVRACSRLLKSNGRFMVVYKSSHFVDLIKELDGNNFGVRRLRFIYDSNKKFSNCFLLEAVKNKKHDVMVLEPIIVNH